MTWHALPAASGAAAGEYECYDNSKKRLFWRVEMPSRQPAWWSPMSESSCHVQSLVSALLIIESQTVTFLLHR